MRPFQFLLLIFIAVPIIEIYLLIQVGGIIGAAWTVGCVVLTAVIGAYLVRRQGLATLTRVQTNLDKGIMPALELMEGIVLLIAGALLLTPGFFTDAVGFTCLVPGLRKAILTNLVKKMIVPRDFSQRGREDSRTIDADYRRIDE